MKNDFLSQNSDQSVTDFKLPINNNKKFDDFGYSDDSLGDVYYN